MAKKKKGQRADGLIEIARKMPDGKTRHFSRNCIHTNKSPPPCQGRSWQDGGVSNQL